MQKSTTVSYTEPFPSLGQWLEMTLADQAPNKKGRIRIQDGAPDYRVCRNTFRPKAHIHASIRYAKNQETFRSKHVDKNLLDASVVRARQRGCDWEVSVWIPKRNPRRRPEHKTDAPPAGPGIPVPAGNRPGWIYIPEDIDEELPF